MMNYKTVCGSPIEGMTSAQRQENRFPLTLALDVDAVGVACLPVRDTGFVLIGYIPKTA